MPPNREVIVLIFTFIFIFAFLLFSVFEIITSISDPTPTWIIKTKHHY